MHATESGKLIRIKDDATETKKENKLHRKCLSWPPRGLFTGTELCKIQVTINERKMTKRNWLQRFIEMFNVQLFKKVI